MSHLRWIDTWQTLSLNLRVTNTSCSFICVQSSHFNFLWPNDVKFNELEVTLMQVSNYIQRQGVESY